MKKITKPNNIINIKSIKEENDNYKLVNTEGYFQERFNFEDYFDNSKLSKFIKSCEKQIRKSNEYSKYIGDLKNNKGLTKCAILGNIDDNDASVEFHHYPFTLYDIVCLCINKHILEKKPFNSFTICRKVLNDHSRNIVGLIPLCVTAHQLVHNGKIFLNINNVYGKLNSFIEEYYNVLTDEMIEKYNKLIEMSENNISYSDEDILKCISEIKEEKNEEDNEEQDEEFIFNENGEEEDLNNKEESVIEKIELKEEDDTIDL